MFQVLNECSMDVFYSCKLLEMLPRRGSQKLEFYHHVSLGASTMKGSDALEHCDSSLDGLGA